MVARRKLSVMKLNRDVVFQSGGPVEKSGTEVDFRAGGMGQEYLIAGWSHPETEYTWTLGKLSVVRLPPPEIIGDHVLRFRSGPMVRPGLLHFQRLDVTVNGWTVARLVCRSAMSYEFRVPGDALKAGGVVDIMFHMPDAVSPRELGGSEDSRDLGVWISSLQFAPLAAPRLMVGKTSFATDKAILMDLQSLGENCELGFVQRWAGAEPLGLFRWASTPLNSLLSVLEAGFEGLGAPEDLTIEMDGATEFHVVDRRYGFRNHSWAYQNKGARREDILKRESIRLPYLARLMLETLEGNDKLFCYHDAGKSDISRISPLVNGLGRYGQNWLLWVTLARGEARSGTAEIVGDRLIKGYIDQFQPIHNVRQPSFDAWIAMIRAAHRLWRAAVLRQ